MTGRWAVVVAGAVLAAGCGRSGPPFGEVTGVVTIDGRPAAGVSVTFLPDPARGAPPGPAAMGVTGADGRYELRHTLVGRDADHPTEGAGAVVGWNKVVVDDYAASSQHLPPSGRVGAAYTNPLDTPLTAEVRPGGQTLNFDLKGPPK